MNAISLRCCKSVIVLGLVGLALHGPAVAAAPDVKSQIQGILSRFDKAYEARDARAIQALLKRYMTPDFTRTLGGGKPTPRAEIIRRSGSDLKQLSSILDASTQIKKLTVNGDTAQALVEGRFVGTMTDPHKVTLKLSNTSASLYTFVKTGGGWKARKMVELSHQFRVNDRLIRSYPAPQKKD